MCASATTDRHERSYPRRLDAAVFAAANARPPDLRAFLGALCGADPILAINALRSLASLGGADHVSSLLAEAHTPTSVATSELPIVHPLDYAWLFTTATQDDLLDRIRADARPEELVVHLGCPTLHLRALHELPDRRHLLLDRDARRVKQANAAAPASAKRVELLNDDVPSLDAAVVVADPPWYPELATAFANAASILLRLGGRLHLAFADALTRPGADDELVSVLAAAEQDGLSLERILPGGCRYDMPPFERAALDAAGLPGVPTDWRLGRLLTLCRGLRPPPTRRHAEDQPWISCEIDGIPLRVRPDAPASGDDLLRPLLDGAVLPTVSRRDPRRHHAALWSSRNRIYASSDPPTLARGVTAFAQGRRDDAPPQIVKGLEALVALERTEHRLRASVSTPHDLGA